MRAHREREVARRSRGQGAATERAVACVVRRMIRASFESTMLLVAESLDLRCRIAEHPHLLSTQVVFHVSGSLADVQRFEVKLHEGARASMHIDPGLIPYGAYSRCGWSRRNAPRSAPGQTAAGFAL